MAGDKPTSVQRTIMQKMADGWKLHYVAGIRRGPSAFISGDNHGEHLRVRVDYLEKLKDKGWIEMCSDPRWAWRSSQYALTELGRAILAGRTPMSDTQGKATPSQKAAERLMKFYLPSMSQAQMANEIQAFYVDLERSHGKLLEALKAIQDLNPFDFQPPIKYSEKVGEMVRAAIQSAEE